MESEMNHGYYVELLDNNLDTFSLLMELYPSIVYI